MMRMLALRVLILATLAGLLVDVGVVHRATPTAVNAEERGIRIDLSYVPGYSTWGPTNVYGNAVLWPQEGVATISVHFLPHLLHGEQYVWWVVNTHSNAALRLGVFNTSEAGDTFMDTFLRSALPAGANAVVVSVAAPGDRRLQPGPQRTLSGLVPPQTFQPTPVSGGGGGTPQPGQGDPQRPAGGTPGPTGRLLPSTGDVPIGQNGQPLPVVVLPRTGGGPGAQTQRGPVGAAGVSTLAATDLGRR